MGLFSRNESAPGSGRGSTSRSSVSSEAQTKELRGRARRRLIGALVLVIAAVVIVPMLLDSPTVTDQTATPLVVPAATPPVSETPPTALSPDTGADNPLPVPDAATPSDSAQSATDAAAQPAKPSGNASSQTEPAPGPEVHPKPEPKASGETKPKTEEKPAEPKSRPVKRTDDGSVARALLAGQKPGQAAADKAPASGSYILQIAAYSTDKDAQIRRDKLAAAGVTNAYVESGVSSGKTTYRLRVGPFPTRDAAQAAQARLRALGYDNGFISTK